MRLVKSNGSAMAGMIREMLVIPLPYFVALGINVTE
jgi:hypothetical protein